MTDKERELMLQAQREYNRQYRERNREKLNAYQKEWRLNNKDKRAAINQRYRENNPEQIKVSRQKYWMKKAGLLTDQQQPAQAPKEPPRVDEYKCVHCGATFKPRRSDAKFCGTSCRVMNNRKHKKQ